MHIHIQGTHNQTLSHLSEKVLSKPSFTRPLMMSGAFGTGRLHHILQYIVTLQPHLSHLRPFSQNENSSDPLYQRIVSLKSPDISTIQCPVSISDMRSFLEEVITQPIELRHKYVIVQNFEYGTKEVQDLFLKTLEDPSPNFYPFITVSSPDRLTPAISSRLIHIPLPSLTMSQIKTIYQATPRLRDYLSILEQYPDHVSTLTPQIFAQFQFSSLSESLLLKAGSPAQITQTVEKFLTSIKNSQVPDSYIIDQFLTFYIRQALLLHPNPVWTESLLKVVGNFSGSLFHYLYHPSREYFITTRNQLINFFTAIYILHIFQKKGSTQ